MQSDPYTSAPLTYVTDVLIDGVVFTILPNFVTAKFIASLLKKHKINTLFILMMFFGILFYMLSSPNNIFAIAKEVPTSLNGYIEQGYISTDTPVGSPIGGVGFSFITITAYFHDKSYFDEFGKWHDGLDIIPNTTYYRVNEAYKKSKQIIIIATMSGKACSFIDDDGGLSVTIDSPNSIDRTFYHHMAVNFIPFKTCKEVINGEPLGVMGQTGNATGIHLHYGVYKKDSRGNWTAYDPLPTI